MTIRGDLDDIAACHCSQCRRWSGHVWAAVPVPDDRLEVEGAEHVRWFKSSDKAERGFCGTCGSSIFWRAFGRGETDVAVGCIEPPTGLRLQRHIWVGDKGDYYDIADGAPQEDRQ
ncbi:GFA family protein [Paracoccus salipaludis]|uniref:Aldehyde-activating protein n=1 Tax=Paracoccus salipaludis TaxID=2032623 RepID=A0A2A2GJD5_9RHOB|nr:GFA family protein [Paracoccus salipaludis]PAU97013.1 aldehyde-activating protein [Paracoccus salipaludis]